VIGYRHCDPRFPFLWEGPGQPPSRWQAGDGPTLHTFADTPDGAWAEFIRHEEIRDAKDLELVRRALWVVDLGDGRVVQVDLPHRVSTGGVESYPACQKAARQLAERGVKRFEAPSAALAPKGAAGWRVEGGLTPGAPRDGKVIVLVGAQPKLVGWAAARPGRPGPELLPRVRHLR
jgi:hypothetical protein